MKRGNNVTSVNKRRVEVCILFCIFTCGLYAIYWMSLLVRNVRALKHDYSSITGEMLCLFLVPFYGFYWWYTRGNDVKRLLEEHDCRIVSTGTLYLALRILGLGIVAMAIMQNDFNEQTVAKLRRPQPKLKANLQAWMIMLPGLILMAFFVWEPLFESIRMSLYKTRNIELIEWNNFDNFSKVVSKDQFLQALGNTFSYTLWSLAIGFFLPIILALLIGETRRSKGIFRTAVYLPNMLPGLAVVILWSAFFSAERYGVLNILMGKAGIVDPNQPIHFLEDEKLVIPIIIAVATWKGAGATALIYMAGLSGVNSDLYEAAAIDGATVRQRIFHITLPAIRKLMGTLLILQIISVFQIMYEPMVLTKGGPDNASLSLMQLMWQYAFGGGSMQFGRASAVAVILTGILLVMTIIYSIVNRRQSDWE